MKEGPIPRLPSLAAFERRPGRARVDGSDGPASETRHMTGRLDCGSARHSHPAATRSDYGPRPRCPVPRLRRSDCRGSSVCVGGGRRRHRSLHAPIAGSVRRRHQRRAPAASRAGAPVGRRSVASADAITSHRDKDEPSALEVVLRNCKVVVEHECGECHARSLGRAVESIAKSVARRRADRPCGCLKSGTRPCVDLARRPAGAKKDRSAADIEA